jgi:glycopeptide antibiotics resistance protein
MSLRRSTMLAWIYLGYVLILTLYPFEFSHAGLRPFSVLSFFAAFGSRDFILNVLLFIPLGFPLYCRLVIGRRTFWAILLAIIVGTAISFLIEFLQMFSDRHPSAGDVVANTVGTAAGAVLAAGSPRRLIRFAADAWNEVERRRVLLYAALLFGLLPLTLSVVQFVAPFSSWNSFFSFQIGNEATLDRPWLGKIHFVAIYNRALTADEIADHFRHGLSHGLSTFSAAPGVISLYRFNEQKGEVVRDLSGFEAPLDLTISPSDGVRWLEPSGIEIFRPAILTSHGEAKKFVDAVRKTHETSIEMWITPQNVVQGGPARIVSFSLDPTVRNFTVGQEASDIHFRLRTLATGRNGNSPALKTNSRFLGTDTFHIVATYKDGIQQLYSNGVEQPGTLDLTRGGIIGVGAHTTAPAYLAYSFLYFAPVGFFCACFFSRRAQTVLEGLLMAIAVTLALQIITESLQAFIFDRPVDGRLIVCALVISAFTAIAVVASNRKARTWRMKASQQLDTSPIP